MIDLRSDTITQPSNKMRQFIAEAPVGDDAFGEDPSVKQLEEVCKELFKKEDALFVTSGMMSNRLAFLTQTTPGDEVITEYNSHVNFFDSAPMSAFAGIVLNPRHTSDGILRPKDVLQAMHSKQRYDYFAQARLISVENTINGLAGKLFPLDSLQALYSLAKEEGLSLHLDGARLFNAHVATGIPLHEYAKWTHTLSVCFSKGLGAPYGSMFMGSQEIVQKARRFRLWLGGGIHQGGMQAAGAYYALTHHIPDLLQDHQNASRFAKMLSTMDQVTLFHTPVETNIVQFSINENPEVSELFLKECNNAGLLLFPWLPSIFRAVFHRGISPNQVDGALSIIKNALSLLEPFCKKLVH